jgi:hypothetical protein
VCELLCPQNERDEFEEFRNQLATLFRQVCLLDPSAGYEFVGTQLQAAFAMAVSGTEPREAFPVVEVAFHLIYALSEVPHIIQKQPDKAPDDDEKSLILQLSMHDLLHTLAVSNISEFPVSFRCRLFIADPV